MTQMTRPKLLLLGAMPTHIPVIKRAKERGIYVITCDYIPENEGHKFANEAHYDSTTDKAAVLKLAKECNVDGVMTFNSDPAAATAAYVSECLGLSGSGYEAVTIMSEKDKFRSFLKENSFNVPKFIQVNSFEECLEQKEKLSFPLMIKPVDSSGSKGVNRIDHEEDLEKRFHEAMSFSRCKRVILEEYIEPQGPQIHGNAFVKDGKVEFIYLGDHHFDPEINNLLPISTTWPSIRKADEIKSVEEEVQHFISAVGYRQGGIDIEARISARDGKVYLIEVGPRNGGDYVPFAIQYASGFSFVDAWLDCVLGENVANTKIEKKGYYCYIVIHAKQSGILNSIYISDSLQKRILERYDYLKPGQEIGQCTSSKYTAGIILAGFESNEEMQDIVENIDSHCKVIVD